MHSTFIENNSMSITIKVLGCGDAFAAGGRFNTCYFVQSASTRFLVDCGGSSLVALKKYGISTSDIDMIVLSHFHGDHYGGVPFFLLDASMSEKRKKPLTILSPRGGKSRIKKLCELLYPGSNLMDFPIAFMEYGSYKPVRINEFGLTAYPVVHKKETRPHALRMEIGDKIISFSGDTGWTEELVKAAKNADLFICECNNYHPAGSTHLSYKEIIKKRLQLRSKKIVLTHLGEEVLNRLDKLELKTLKDGMELKV